MKRALLSVSDKTDIVWLAQQLHELGYEILSTGGTAAVLTQAGISVLPVETVTGSPEMLDGRVKTLHPKIHGGLLALRDNPAHQADLRANDIQPIDLVCVNLYPFQATISRADVTIDEAIEQIDIGGPSMLRSAAKNVASVTALCDRSDYQTVIEELRTHGDTLPATRRRLSAKVFRHTAYYDAVIAQYLGADESNPEWLTLPFDLVSSLRYGENPHQAATLYRSPNRNPYSLFEAEILNGKPLSYNNMQDANAAINILAEHDQPTVVALKHMNPCGVGSATDLDTAFTLAYESDPVSIFGGIVACNRPVTKALAKRMNEMFLEIILAPAYEDGALEELKRKKNLRVLALDTSASNTDVDTFVAINGGLLRQGVDRHMVDKKELKVVTKQGLTDEEMEDLLFAWKVVKHVKSNAIVLTEGRQTVGIGAGQMNRVGAARIALDWAKERGHTKDLILASDAFFPFDDVVRLAAEYGVKAIIQPGGSIRDDDSIRACDELGIAMVFTGNRHFKH
jgi:phosphoribosylaminoimidazolecarboxamide formyltransferase/IMP cyclohydrolase